MNGERFPTAYTTNDTAGYQANLASQRFQQLWQQRLSTAALQATVTEASPERTGLQIRSQALFTALGQTAADTTGDILRDLTGTGTTVGHQTVANRYDSQLHYQLTA